MAVVGLDGFTMFPLPETKVHCPVAGKIGAVPFVVAEVTGVHSCWSVPAVMVCALLNTVMLTRSLVDAGAHGPLVTVQRKVFTPTLKPLTVVVGLVALANTPVPETTVQVPIAGNTACVAARSVDVWGKHNC